jgi:hypothetical protein
VRRVPAALNADEEQQERGIARPVGPRDVYVQRRQPSMAVLGVQQRVSCVRRAERTLPIKALMRSVRGSQGQASTATRQASNARSCCIIINVINVINVTIANRCRLDLGFVIVGLALTSALAPTWRIVVAITRLVCVFIVLTLWGWGARSVSRRLVAIIILIIRSVVCVSCPLMALLAVNNCGWHMLHRHERHEDGRW